MRTAIPAPDARRRRRIAPLLSALAVAASLVACAHSTSGTATTPHPATSAAGPSTGTHPSAAAPPPVKSDEDQARQTVYDMQNAYNSRNWEAYTELMCTAMRAKFTGVIMDAVKRDRERNGTVVIKSVTITINGDDATSILDGVSEGLGPNRIPINLKREDGWKICVLN